MPTLPKIFVASSGEAERLAQAIQQNLSNAEVTLWTQDAFRIGHVIIDELNRNLQQSDFGVFLFAPNDVVMIRGQKQQAVRDNVVLELGMFIGRLGKERSFIVQPKGSPPTCLASSPGSTTRTGQSVSPLLHSALHVPRSQTRLSGNISARRESWTS